MTSNSLSTLATRQRAHCAICSTSLRRGLIRDDCVAGRGGATTTSDPDGIYIVPRSSNGVADGSRWIH